MQANITVNGPASCSHANWDYNRKDVTYDGIIWNSRGKSFGSWPSSSRDIQSSDGINPSMHIETL